MTSLVDAALTGCVVVAESAGGAVDAVRVYGVGDVMVVRTSPSPR